ncbi:MAG: hypothetical protein M3487_09640, partial [Actinomycetota bacterium]|nr:hypothetical protein [Actinomycetota bacterium]
MTAPWARSEPLLWMVQQPARDIEDGDGDDDGDALAGATVPAPARGGGRTRKDHYGQHRDRDRRPVRSTADG